MTKKIDTYKANQMAWNKKVEENIKWSMPVTKEQIEKAKINDLDLVLCVNQKVDKNWLFDDMKNKKILCLASGGGQQAPLFAASGANVLLLDSSTKQIEVDEKIMKENNLNYQIINGNMCFLEQFKDGEFDMVFNPVSVTYIEDVNPMFKEVSRVLKKNGRFLFGAPNPLIYLFCEDLEEKGILQVKNKIPYFGKDHLTKEDIRNNIAIENSHTLDDLIGGIVKNNMLIKGFKEEKAGYLIDEYINTYFSIYAIKE